MFRICRHPLLALAIALPALVGGQAQAAPDDLKKVRVLLVFDTVDRELRDQLVKDEKRVKKLLTSYIPKGRLTVQVLSGREVTREKILAYYRDLRTSSEESLLFFYGGHGAV